MKSPAFTLLCLAAVFASPAVAAPVEFDTASAHIIVVRPVDIWSGDAGAQGDSLDMVKAKRANYVLQLVPGTVLRGGPHWFESPANHPIVAAVREALQPYGFSISSDEDYVFGVRAAETIEPDQFEAVRDAQAETYKQIIADQGDPDTLHRRLLGRKLAGNVLALLTLGVAGGALGPSGATVALGSGIVGDAYQAPSWVPNALAPALLPALDPKAYKTIEMRRLVYRSGMIGQIVIAYHDEKTPQAESEALVKAIVSATGADTTPEAIEASRASDLAYRESVWKTCVAEYRCGPDLGRAPVPKADPSPDAKPVVVPAAEPAPAQPSSSPRPSLTPPEPAASSVLSGDRTP